jgi:hypothetical protein
MHLLVIPKHKQTTHILSNAFELHVFPFTCWYMPIAFTVV